mgnify:CR=1 FL=1
MINDVYNAKILGFAGNIARLGRLDHAHERGDTTSARAQPGCRRYRVPGFGGWNPGVPQPIQSSRRANHGRAR